jgi:hypothetical protein
LSSAAVRAPLRRPTPPTTTTTTTAAAASPVPGRASTAPVRAKRGHDSVRDSGLGGSTATSDSDVTPPPEALHSSKRARTTSASASISGGARAALSQTDRASAMSQPRRVNPSRRKWN